MKPYKHKDQTIIKKIQTDKKIKRLSRYFTKIYNMPEHEAKEIATTFYKEPKITEYAYQKLNEHDKQKIIQDNEYMKKHIEAL